MNCIPQQVTSAFAELVIQDNATWNDAFQFGDPTDTTWSFTGQTFRLDIKASADDTSALLSSTSGGGQIVVDSPTLRVLHMNVPESAIVAALPAAEYVYELMMIDGSSPAVRVPLMHGPITVQHGVTGG